MGGGKHKKSQKKSKNRNNHQANADKKTKEKEGSGSKVLRSFIEKKAKKPPMIKGILQLHVERICNTATSPAKVARIAPITPEEIKIPVFLPSSSFGKVS